MQVIAPGMLKHVGLYVCWSNIMSYLEIDDRPYHMAPNWTYKGQWSQECHQKNQSKCSEAYLDPCQVANIANRLRFYRSPTELRQGAALTP